MNESKITHKPSDDRQFKTRFIMSQCRVQQSLKEPSSLSSALMFIVYIQCLKYTIDLYSQVWFGSDMVLFAYFDLSCYTEKLPSIILSSIGLAYVLWSFMVGLEIIKGKKMMKFTKVLQMLFGTLFFKSIIGSNCVSLNNYFFRQTQSIIGITLSVSCMILFSITAILQTFTRFQFLFTKNKVGTNRTSNWSTCSLLIYIIINQVTWQCSDQATSVHAVVRNIFFVLHAIVFLFKWEIQEQFQMKVELFGLVINFVALVVELTIQSFAIELGIGFFVILLVGVLVTLFNLHYFNVNFELENVNKWSTTQIIISYTFKLRTLLRNFDKYYYKILFLGYIEIHEQKCDDESCPLRNITHLSDDNVKKTKFQEMIKRIYKDGYHFSPVSAELMLENAIFLYEIGAIEKALKILLEIKYSELQLDKLYKLIRLKTIIHKQISEIPDKEFLDLMSQIKIKDLQQKIITKFEQASLISLQFWSCLNQDHPNFKKVYEVGKQRSISLGQIQNLYQQIKQIAYSQKITALYIHYLNLIGNQERMYSEIQEEMKNEQGFQDNIVIEDWSNCPFPIMMVSLEEETHGVIIDLNTTCATLFNHQKFDFIGKHLKTLFSDALSSQVQSFMDFKVTKQEPFFVSFNRSFSIKIFRKMQVFSSINTGLCLIITLEHIFRPNSCFLVFNSQSKLIVMSSSAIPLLGFEEQILDTECYFSDLFAIPINDISEERRTFMLKNMFSDERINMRNQAQPTLTDIHRNVFNITKTRQKNFSVLTFQLVKKSKRNQNSVMRLQMHSQLNYSIISEQQQVTNNDFYSLSPAVNFYFHASTSNHQFTYSSSSSYQVEHSPRQNIMMLDVGEFVARHARKYVDNITTLRLEDGYLKVLEEANSESSQDGDLNVISSSTNQLIKQQCEISKIEELEIFKNRKNYNDFIEKNPKRVFVGYFLAVSILVWSSLYVVVELQLKSIYDTLEASYYRSVLGIEILGQLAESTRLLHQSKLLSLNHDPETEAIMKSNVVESLAKLQELMTHYNAGYLMPMYRDRVNKQILKSDEFFYSFISQYAKFHDRLLTQGTDNFTGEDQNSLFIEMNGNVTKSSLYPRAEGFKKLAKKTSLDSLNSFTVLNCVGFLISFMLTFSILFALKKINDIKLEVLSIFLEITEKQLHSNLENTQNFLMILHVDEPAEKNDLNEEAFDNKKASSGMFAKKKRFKETKFQKSPFVILSLFFFFSIGFFCHLLYFSMFFSDAIDYFGVMANYSDVYAYSQARIYKRMFECLNQTSPVYDSQLAGMVNTQILGYERLVFNWHFKTFSSIPAYNQLFTNLYTKQICNNGLDLQYSCSNETSYGNGTLLLITDLIVEHTMIDYTKPLNRKIFLTNQMIKNVHEYLLKQVHLVSRQFFVDLRSNILIILMIWMVTIILIGVLLLIYFHRIIKKDFLHVKNMLKFFTVSYARKSDPIRKYIATIIGQKIC